MVMQGTTSGRAQKGAAAGGIKKRRHAESLHQVSTTLLQHQARYRAQHQAESRSLLNSQDPTNAPRPHYPICR